MDFFDFQKKIINQLMDLPEPMFASKSEFVKKWCKDTNTPYIELTKTKANLPDYLL